MALQCPRSLAQQLGTRLLHKSTLLSSCGGYSGAAACFSRRQPTRIQSVRSTLYFVAHGQPCLQIRWAISRPWRQSTQLWPLPQQQRLYSSAAQAETEQVEVEVDIAVEGNPLSGDRDAVEQLLQQLEEDCQVIVQQVLLLEAEEEGSAEQPGPAELSVVLCSDEHIQGVNQEWRGKDSATDVLSFPMDDDLHQQGYPARVLGDVLVSLDTALRQAQEREYSLREECRVLLLHGVLHLLGYDHELGPQEAADMAAAEQHIMARLGWQGQGLIAAAGGEDGILHTDYDSGNGAGGADSSSGSSASTAVAGEAAPVRRRAPRPNIRLLALDMDGTLLDSRSRILPSTVDALQAALAAGVTVCLATGKARPAAVAAMTTVGLAGEGLVVSPAGPGIFLQGLAVHGAKGQQLQGPSLPRSVVADAFRYAQEHGIALCGFLGDSCVTLQMREELLELHETYYEPLAAVAGSLEELLSGPEVKKLLFMAPPASVDTQLRPAWDELLQGTQAELMQAVPNMLEVVPRGINKWVGMQHLLSDMGITAEQLMAVGDGSNDLQLVANAGLGIAMRNAVPEVLRAAKFVTSSNDDDGVAEAVERFIL